MARKELSAKAMAALAAIDKKAAARAATALAARVARGIAQKDSNHNVRLVAEMVATGLDMAVQGLAPGDGRRSGASSTEPLGPDPGASFVAASQSTAATTRSQGWPFTNADDSPLDGPDERVTVQSPFAPASEVTLQAPIDAANCGDYSFALYTAQLIVSMLGTGGSIGGEYSIPSLPVHDWVRLIGRGGDQLPIIVRRDHGCLAIKVGNVPSVSSAIAPTR